ncbi:MAG: ROK family protein [Acidobacteria bacterium]|nr:MAG: ROK family protein [Acidobacteriota bacterium]
MSNVLAVDIGGTHFRVALFDASGRRLLLSEGRTESAGGREWMLNEIRERAHDLVTKSGHPVQSCGISFGGPVDYRRQLVSSMHVSGWRGFRLGQWMEDNLSLKCCVDNDANAGALGEFHWGVGRGTESLLYLTISTGIGGGVVCGGRVHRGKDSMAGEVGHIQVSDAGTLCSCGARGCLETVCSGTAIGTRARGFARRKPEAMARTLALASGNPDQITAELVFRAAGEGEESAQLIVREAARALARALLTAIRILNPDVIVLGGGVALSGPTLLDPVHEYMDEFSAPMLEHSTKVVQAELGNYSPLHGAAAMALELT